MHEQARGLVSLDATSGAVCRLGTVGTLIAVCPDGRGYFRGSIADRLWLGCRWDVSMLRSDDPLPQNVIRFSEAFDRFFRASEPTAKSLEDNLYQAFKSFVSCSSGDCEKLQKKWHAAIDALESAQFAAWCRWRHMLEL